MSSSQEYSRREASEADASVKSGTVSRRAFMAASAAATLPVSVTESHAVQAVEGTGVYRFTGPNTDFHGHQ